MEDLSEYEHLYNKNWLKSERKLIELHKRNCVPPYIRPNITATGIIATSIIDNETIIDTSIIDNETIIKIQ